MWIAKTRDLLLIYGFFGLGCSSNHDGWLVSFSSIEGFLKVFFVDDFFHGKALELDASICFMVKFFLCGLDIIF